ncbi:hypothetical protein RBU49_06800 [Clostridium sp. MB40-C1]|uniref:hypothetical protein n=1 Tax=Clostridium sp. MB40-C1 TaxID=3070996 RepID=UPI0027E1670B|nr:hypothetical protein [Clostridium sp. MB40-C1]WMJ81951.1 hypothetical protein RBU49_06800 [Clostridium sp. MB40-C1]
MKGSIWIENEKIGDVESIEINKSIRSNEKVIKPMNFECKGKIKIENRNTLLQVFLPNFKEVKRLLDIAKYTRKIRRKKKLYRRAFKLANGLPLTIYNK